MWTKEGIQALIQTNDRAVERAVVSIYRYQTYTEKLSKATTDHNGMGFNAFDAEILTSFAEQLLSGWSLTPKQMGIARKKMVRYWRQLLEIAKNTERIRAEMAQELEAA